jgi:general secretion pathway protein L
MALILGIDIGKSSVRAAAIRTSLRNVEVERYLEQPLSGLSGQPADAPIVAAAVRELLASLPARPDTLVAAMDGARASARTVRIPQAAKKRAAEVLPFELESVLPFEVSAAVIDYQEVAERDADVELLVVAASDVVVGEALAELASYGLDPKELAVTHLALEGYTALSPQPDDTVWLLVDVGHGRSDLCITRRGRAELCRTIDEGLGSPPGALLSAIKRTLMKYRSEGGPIATHAFLMGDGANDPALVEALGSGLGIPTEPARLPTARGSSERPLPSFGLALSLAARMIRRGKRIDLRKGKHALARGAGGLRSHAALIAGCAAALLFSFGFRTWAEYRVLESERDALVSRLASVSEAQLGERTENPRRARELLEGGGTSRDPLPRFDAFRALAAISNAYPSSTLHDTRKLEISIDETGQSGKFEIQGQIPDLAARDAVAEALEAHECIAQIERGKSSPVPGQDRKNYVLEGALGCGGSPKKKAQANRAQSESP